MHRPDDQSPEGQDNAPGKQAGTAEAGPPACFPSPLHISHMHVRVDSSVVLR